MKYVDEYRDPKQCRRLADLINRAAEGRSYKIMEVCGTHTQAICQFGLKSLLADGIHLISGPGCPVCVTTDGYLRQVFRLLGRKNIIVATYADMLRVPVDGSSLEEKRAEGAAVRAVSSAWEAVELAQRMPEQDIVFLGVGFETTAPGTAIALKMARKAKIKNFSVYSSHKTIPEALEILGRDGDLNLDGFLLPGHVSAIIGLDGYRPVIRKLKIPAVITGFEPVDILLAIYQIIMAVNNRKSLLENEYARVVADKGNSRAKSLLREVFEKRDGLWRGLGRVAHSALALRGSFAGLDAAKKFNLREGAPDKNAKKGCRCADVLKGVIEPSQCRSFKKACKPQSPLGPCMVSREGTCRSYYEYK